MGPAAQHLGRVGEPREEMTPRTGTGTRPLPCESEPTLATLHICTFQICTFAFVSQMHISCTFILRKFVSHLIFDTLQRHGVKTYLVAYGEYAVNLTGFLDLR